MTLFEVAENKCVNVCDIINKHTFSEECIYSLDCDKDQIIIEYCAAMFPFTINSSAISILLDDIHNNNRCGMMFVDVPVGNDSDTIIYIIRFSDEEFKKIKKFLTKFPK